MGNALYSATTRVVERLIANSPANQVAASLLDSERQSPWAAWGGYTAPEIKHAIRWLSGAEAKPITVLGKTISVDVINMAMAMIGGGEGEGLQALSGGLEGFTTESQIFRHYTDAAGFEGIMTSNMIRANESGRVFATPLALSAETAQQVIFRGFQSHAGRGAYVIEFRLKPGVLFQPGPKPNEFIHRGTIRFDRHVEILFSGENPY